MSVESAYVLFPNEGRNFYHLSSELSFFAYVEGFLAKHLGGTAEPFGAEIVEAEIAVRLGAQHILGLKAALLTGERGP